MITLRMRVEKLVERVYESMTSGPCPIWPAFAFYAPFLGGLLGVGPAIQSGGSRLEGFVLGAIVACAAPFVVAGIGWLIAIMIDDMAAGVAFATLVVSAAGYATLWGAACRASDYRLPSGGRPPRPRWDLLVPQGLADYVKRSW